MEVVGSGPGPEVGPEEVHHLLPVEPVISGQAEQLDYAGGLPEPPPVLLHDARSHGDFETPEQGYAQASRLSDTGSVSVQDLSDALWRNSTMTRIPLHMKARWISRASRRVAWPSTGVAGSEAPDRASRPRPR